MWRMFRQWRFREAEDAGIVAALVITIGTPEILNPVRSAHLFDVCA